MVVGRLFLAVPQGCLRFLIVVFPDHTHLLFLGEDAFTRNTLFDLEVKVEGNIAQYPLHYMNYAPVKFAVATTKR